MKPESPGPSGMTALRWPYRWPLSFTTTVAWSVALALILASTTAILQFRSPKYLIAMIAVGVGAAAFLVMPRKHATLLFAVGFSLPYHAQIILVERDNLLSITGTFLLTALLAMVCLATGRIRMEKINLVPAISVPALVLVAAGLLSLVNTTDKTDTFIVLAQNLEMLLLFLVLVNTIEEKTHLLTFLRGLYLGFAIQCCIYVIQNVSGFSFEVVGNAEYVGVTDPVAGRIVSHRGTFGGTPAQAALYFSVFTLFLVGVFLCRQRPRLYLHPVLGMVMGGGCLLLSAKRAPLGGFVIAMVLMSLIVSRYSAHAMKRLARVLVVLAVPLMVLLPVLLLRAEADHADAYEERRNLTRVARNMFEAHPIVGVGLGTYDSMKRAYMPEDWAGWIYKVHNRYMLLLAESGLVGLGAFLLLFAMILVTAYRGIPAIDVTYRPLQIALFCGLVSVTWEMLWDIFDLRTQGYMTWFLVSLAVILPRVLAPVRSTEAV